MKIEKAPSGPAIFKEIKRNDFGRDPARLAQI